MTKAIALVALLPALSVLHRFRGGGLFVWRAPIHRRYIATLILFPLLMLLAVPWKFALFIALQYLLLVLLPWGRWYTIGYGARELSGEAGPFESILEGLTVQFSRRASDYICFVVRNLICLLPCFAAAWYLHTPNPAIIALALAVGIPEIYRLCWYYIDELDVPTAYAEWFVGGFIGLAIVVGILAR